ncbi:ATP/GTP-binding protein [Rhizohabitans arisaemae]|uniref:ATP/GTP-binding protein n=1 Tax=Rhizohabitans arisaemae TaxID=2720610 RepID=UPI0024B1B362|nr:ATP/GTP-binding protein [Rhizohabitans arisaemae]
MSPRRSRRRDPFDRGGRAGTARPVGGTVTGIENVEEGSDGEWVVRTVTGGGTDKVYRCPGCQQEIQPGTPHLVTWPNWADGEGERRHWHGGCWRKRVDRGPGRTRY